MLLCDCVRSLSQFLSIDKLLKNDNFSELGLGKSSTTTLYSESTKREKFFDGKKAIKNVKITKQSHASKSYTSTYNFDILNSFSRELQLKNTGSAIKNKLKYLLSELRGFNFVTILVLELKKIKSDNATKYSTFYLNSKAETVINEIDIDDVFESIYRTIISNIQKSPGRGSGWIADSVVNHTINISKYNTLG